MLSFSFKIIMVYADLLGSQLKQQVIYNMVGMRFLLVFQQSLIKVKFHESVFSVSVFSMHYLKIEDYYVAYILQSLNELVGFRLAVTFLLTRMSVSINIDVCGIITKYQNQTLHHLS